MIKNVYGNNNNTVENFSIMIDENEIHKIIKEIDNWYGKGDIKTIIFPYLIQNEGYKYEIISTTFKGNTNILDTTNDYSIYEFMFYEYKQHPLSKLAELILTSDKQKLGFFLKQLYDWQPQNEEEYLFTTKLISSIILHDTLNSTSRFEEVEKLIRVRKKNITKLIKKDQLIN